jgi:hypothetical protein
MFNFGKRKAVALYRENLAAWERNLYTSRPAIHPLAYFSGGAAGNDAFFSICTEVTKETMDQFLRLWATNDSRIQDELEQAWKFVEVNIYPDTFVSNHFKGIIYSMDEALRRITQVRQAEKIAALVS